MDNWVEEYINDEKTKKIFGEWGENIAHDKGYRKGKKEQAIEIAKTMLKDNLSMDKIIQYTGLTETEINNIEK